MNQPQAMPPAPPMPLEEALARVERVFGIETLMREQGRDIVEPYYLQAEKGYRRFHSKEGCMHLALNADGRFDADGYLEQARTVSAQMSGAQARDVIELGCGFGFNTLHLARWHPECSFLGLDLMEKHVTEAARSAEEHDNVTFRQGSFEPLAVEPESADLAFGVECLCYAKDLDRTIASVAQALRPGGRLVIFDAYRRGALDDTPADLASATRLTEITMAVTQGFRPVAEWTAAMERAGLTVCETRDLSAQVAPTFRRMQGFALTFFDGLWKAKIASALVSPYLLRNTVAGLLWPYTVEGPAATLSYDLLVAEKPAA